MSAECSTCSRQPMSAEEENKCLYRMADGRHFTQYVPSCGSYAEMRSVNGLASSYDTRMFLMNNAEKIMAMNLQSSVNKNACPCFPHDSVGTMLPEKEMMQCNAQYCKFYGKDDNGLGLGRNFSS